MFNRVFMLVILIIVLILSKSIKQKMAVGGGNAQIGNKKIDISIVEDSSKQARGLMNITKLSKDSGMLFVFSVEQVKSFWMKNTLIPLSIAFINSQYKIVKISDLKPHSEIPVSSDVPIKYALEMNKGWFKGNGIKVGDTFSFDTSV